MDPKWKKDFERYIFELLRVHGLFVYIEPNLVNNLEKIVPNKLFSMICVVLFLRASTK